jgi:hypothetical protein
MAESHGDAEAGAGLSPGASFHAFTHPLAIPCLPAQAVTTFSHRQHPFAPLRFFERSNDNGVKV